MQTIRFKKLSPRLYAAKILKSRTDIRGQRFQALEAVRAIEEYDGWRIDQAGAIAGTWLPWEAIDNTRYTNARAAKQAIRAYATA